MNQKYERIRTVVSVVISLITVVCIIVGVAIHVFGIGDSFEKKDESNDAKKGEQMAGNELEFSDDIKSIIIKCDASNITVKKGDKCAVYTSGDENKRPTVSENQGTLYINEEENSIFNFAAVKEVPQITVQVSDSAKLSEVEIESDFGDVEVSNLTIGDLNVEQDCGDITFKSLKTEKIDVSNDQGNIEFSSVIAENIVVESDLGDVKGINLKGDRVKIEQDCGKVDVEGEINYISVNNDLGDVNIDNTNENFEYDINCSVGKVTINGKPWGSSN